MRERVTGTPATAPTLSECVEGIQLRKAREEDIPQLIRLHRVALRELNRSQYTTTQLDSLLMHLPPTDYVPTRLHAYLVAQVQRAIVCVGGWGVTRQVSGVWTMFDVAAISKDEDIATISALYTHPEWIRRGIARSVLTALEDDVRTAGHLGIEVPALLSTVPMFLACGYAVCRPCRLLLPDGVSLDLTWMRKRLTSQPCRCRRAPWAANAFGTAQEQKAPNSVHTDAAGT